MRFLVVDDSAKMRRIIVNTLREIGHPDVEQAANGREGLDHLANDGFDVVITDWNMPEMNGLEFVRSIRATESLKHVPVLMVTANIAHNDILNAINVGVSGFLLKPFTFDQMKEKIEAIAGQ